MREIEVKWTKHFKERLKERFKLELTEDDKKEIQKVIFSGPVFCKLLKLKKRNNQTKARIYQVVLYNKKVMVVVRRGSSSGIYTVISAYRREWFSKCEDGKYGYAYNNHKQVINHLKFSEEKNQIDYLIYTKQVAYLNRLKLNRLMRSHAQARMLVTKPNVCWVDYSVPKLKERSYGGIRNMLD